MSLTFAKRWTSIADAGLCIETSLVTYLAIEELFLDVSSETKSTPDSYVTEPTSKYDASSSDWLGYLIKSPTRKISAIWSVVTEFLLYRTLSIILPLKSSLIGCTSTFNVNSWVWLFHIVVLPVMILSYVSNMIDGFLATIVDAWSILKNTCDGLESTTTVVKELWFPRVTVSPFWKNWLVFTLT